MTGNPADHYATFDFPLNVYARALEIENGAVHSLHYGFWSDDTPDLTSAQRAATELLWKHLPPAPARVLEVGIGLGSTAGALIDAGYDYAGVVPDADQIAFCRAALAPREPHFLCSKFEDLDDEPQVDLILFQESAQYVPPAELLATCCRLLRPGGSVLIFDEMSAAVANALGRTLFASGLRLDEEFDVTERAAPSVRYLHETIEKHRQQLLEELGITESLLDGFQEVLRGRERAYAEGRYYYRMLRLLRAD
ncbi:MAG: class I SAM-dependent methyltransferase [Acidobacteriota bacterium]